MIIEIRMDFSANIDFNADELADFLEELVQNLKQSRTLELPLGFTHASMNVGEAKIKSKVEIKEEGGLNNLRINFEWQEITSVEPEKVVEVGATSANIVNSSSEETFIEETSEVVLEPLISTAPLTSDKKLKKRMILNTTTFSTDVGSYISTDVAEQSSQWELIIDRDAQPANLKWNQETEMFEGIPKIPARTHIKSIHEEKPEKKSRSYITTIEGTEIADKNVPMPTPSTMKAKASAPPMASASKTQKSTPPRSRPKSSAPVATIDREPVAKAPQPRGRIKSKQAPENNVTNEWHEPDRADISTGDDWVKPSEILKKKKQEPITPSKPENTISPPKNPNIIEEPTGFKPSDIAKLTGTNDIPAPVTEERGRPDPQGEKKKKKKKKSGWAEW